ncbi:MAG: hypothetical protein RLZZ366_1538 [Pseudomonadota bacterium]|jgi:hypothetical protein
MRKFTLAISIATASLMVSACNNPAEAPKDEATTVDATEAMAPVADANAANVADGNGDEAKMAVSGEANSAVDDDKGGDPGGRK